jgi:hypothetical protein
MATYTLSGSSLGDLTANLLKALSLNSPVSHRLAYFTCISHTHIPLTQHESPPCLPCLTPPFIPIPSLHSGASTRRPHRRADWHTHTNPADARRGGCQWDYTGLRGRRRRSFRGAWLCHMFTKVFVLSLTKYWVTGTCRGHARRHSARNGLKTQIT